MAATRRKIEEKGTALTVPFSLEAEQSVLGSLMLDNALWDKVIDLIKADDFYQPNHRLIFDAMAALSHRNQPFDVLTLTEYLKVNQQLVAIGGEVYLFELTKNTPIVANVIAYAEIVRDRSVLRHLIDGSREIAELALNPDGKETGEILEQAESKIFALTNRHKRGIGPVEINDLLAQATERIDALFHSDSSITGLATGFGDFDDLTSGLQKGELIIVAGRPSMGKTSFAMNMVENVLIKAKQGVLVFSMEMPGESLAMRMISSLGRIDQNKVRSGKLKDEDWPRLTSAVAMLSDAPLYIDETPSLSPAEVRSRARRLMRADKSLGLIVVDYLQLMQIPGFKEGRVAEITQISRSLKALAKELNMPVLALSQLNRGLEQRIDKRPQMADLRESGAIEQDADMIVFIYRDEVYHEETNDKGIAEIIIGKQRNGPIGRIKLAFLGKYTRFENLSTIDYGTPGSDSYNVS